MSYLTFHLLFILPPILALAFTQPRPLAGQGSARARWGIPLICLIAFVYTTPWDNFLVYRNVWSYGPERVLATVGYVPVEEYAFFLLQPVLTGLLLYQLLGRLGRSQSGGKVIDHPIARHVGTSLFVLLSTVGVGLLLSGWEHGLYAGLILAWAGPVLAVLWAVGGNVAWDLGSVFFGAVLIPSVYLWCADAIALRAGIWHITDATSLGASVLGLPVEEAVFFLVTNTLVVLGLLVWLYSDRTAGHRFLQRLYGEAPTEYS
jgi:lycopene cyclase domain-containing protein